jgi:putative hydrolase of the HAD superfamily
VTPVPLKAVIFDYGNVLSLPQTMDDIAAMGRVADIPAEKMHSLYWQFRLAFDRADLDVASYWSAVAKGAGRDFGEEQLKEIIRLDNESWSRPDPVMLGWAATLRAVGIRTGILSNMPVTLRRHLTANADWLRGFNDYTYSCDVNMVKPEPGIYAHALKGLGVIPAEALFLDDREPNVQAAGRMGIHALLFLSAEQANHELDGHYVLPRIAVT